MFQSLLWWHKGVGAAAIFYKNDRIVKISRFHLSAANKHTVYEAELVRVLLALSSLTSLACQLINAVLIGLDNQVVIWALNDQMSKPSHYLLNLIHMACEKLQEKQDKLQNAADFHIARQQGIVARTRGIFDLQVQWVQGHKDFKPNEKANTHAKKAAEGNSSQGKGLLKALRKPFPLSFSAIWQDLKLKIQWKWTWHWKMLPHYCKTCAIDKTTPSKKWLKLVVKLSRSQASLLFQLCTSHISLNKHLFHIKWAASLACPNCNDGSSESIQHFLFECGKYWWERHKLQRTLRWQATNLAYLLTNTAATLPLLKYIHLARHLKQTFGAVYSAV